MSGTQSRCPKMMSQSENVSITVALPALESDEHQQKYKVLSSHVIQKCQDSTWPCWLRYVEVLCWIQTEVFRNIA